MAEITGSFAVTPDEVQAEFDEVSLPDFEGTSLWPGMTFEQGIEAALAWVLGKRNQRPYTDGV